MPRRNNANSDLLTARVRNCGHRNTGRTEPPPQLDIKRIRAEIRSIDTTTNRRM